VSRRGRRQEPARAQAGVAADGAMLLAKAGDMDYDAQTMREVANVLTGVLRGSRGGGRPQCRRRRLQCRGRSHVCSRTLRRPPRGVDTARAPAPQELLGGLPPPCAWR
jgi:hypothetical protein